MVMLLLVVKMHCTPNPSVGDGMNLNGLQSSIDSSYANESLIAFSQSAMVYAPLQN